MSHIVAERASVRELEELPVFAICSRQYITGHDKKRSAQKGLSKISIRLRIITTSRV